MDRGDVVTIYATLADLEARFAYSELVQLTDDELTGAIVQSRVDAALASASALVAGYVSATYQLDPALPVPLLLIDAACDIARFKLYRTAPPEDVSTRNSQALRTLQSIRSGTIKIDTGAEAIPAREGKILLQSGVRRMARDQMEGF